MVSLVYLKKLMKKKIKCTDGLNAIAFIIILDFDFTILKISVGVLTKKQIKNTLCQLESSANT